MPDQDELTGFSWIDSPLALRAAHAIYARFDHDPARIVRSSIPQVVPPSLGGAVPKRIAEFIAGRRCAARALAWFDPALAEVEIRIGEAREPVWPPGWVGAITHSARIAAAAVAPSSVLVGVGIDTEDFLSDAALDDVLQAAVSEGEIARATAAAAGWDDERALATLIFSAKESLFKCVYPLVQRFLDFDQAALEDLDPATGTFRLRLRRDAGVLRSGQLFCGTFAFAYGGVHTAIELTSAELLSEV
jgi:enterobactin synthetase component D